jgi:Fe-S cluster assembly protein SufB
MSGQDTILGEHIDSEYKYGFSTDIETDTASIGLSEDTVRFISAARMNQNGCSNGGLQPIASG